MLRKSSTARACADELERWIEVADVNGFKLSYVSIPKTFHDIIEHLLPESRRRGLFYEGNAVPDGTLRKNHVGIKDRRLDDTHPEAKYFWRAGEDGPTYAIPEVNDADAASRSNSTSSNSKKR